MSADQHEATHVSLETLVTIHSEDAVKRSVVCGDGIARFQTFYPVRSRDCEGAAWFFCGASWNHLRATFPPSKKKKSFAEVGSWKMDLERFKALCKAFPLPDEVQP